MSLAHGANAGPRTAFAIRVSTLSAKGFDLYLIETVNLATKVHPRKVRVERQALISDQAHWCSRLRSSYGLDSELKTSSHPAAYLY